VTATARPAGISSRPARPAHPGVPARTPRSGRATEIVAAARAILEAEGRDALTMRRLAQDLGIRAPSLYKHFADKAAIESALIEDAFAELGGALHGAVEQPGRRTSLVALLAEYRRQALANPNLYRLATAGRLDREAQPPGLEDWAGEPFALVAGDAQRAQALWSFAHGMVILEIDGRFPEGSDLDGTWKAGAAAFEER
jgi:AcrR family transcriptional regulator